MKLHELAEQRANKVAEMRQLLNTAEVEKRSLSDNEKAAFDALKIAISNLEADEQRSAFLEQAERGQPVDKSLQKLEAEISLVDAINAQVENRSLTGALAEYAKEHEQRTGQKAKGVAVPMSLFEQRAQTTTTAAGIVPNDFRADQFVGLLRNALVVRSLGARVLPNLRGDIVIPRQKSSATAYWIAEGEALTESGLTFDNINMGPKHVGAITELSRQLLQQSNPAIEQLVRDDFVHVVSAAVDKALIDGDGVKEPTGLLNITGTTPGSLATLDWASVMENLETLEMLNIVPNSWLAHPSVTTLLRTTLKEAGLPGYLMQDGRLAGVPVASTQHLDVGNAILGDFSQMVIGTWGGVDILANPYASGVYERGGVQIRILTTLGMVARRPEAFVMINDIE